jgi:hypothetical protein
MNYLQIRLILSIYKNFYNFRQTTAHTSYNRLILTHGRIIRRVTTNLIELSPELTDEQKEDIERDYTEILIAIYHHFRCPYRCRLLYT